MALLDTTYDASELPEGDSYELIPAGWYSASIDGAELKTTKAGTGKYISLKLGITGPTHEGRIVWGNLNIKNPSPSAEEIGRRQLGDVMRAIGLARVQDTDQLIGGQLMIKVGIKPANDGYEAQNQIKAYKAAGESPAPAFPKPEQDKPKSEPKAQPSSAPPWAKR